jgi:cytidine diphosphoramidate kinase
MAGSVLWVTGLSGSGKTTLCQALWHRLKPSVPELVLLDGDALRAAFGASLAYDIDSRRVQIGRIQGLAQLLSGQGLHVLVAALYAADDLLAWNRENLPGYTEVYMKASLDLLRRRDSKGLYGNATKHVVGVDIPWNAPPTPDLTVDADLGEAPDRVAKAVMAVWCGPADIRP